MEENQNTKGQLPNENSIPSAVQQNSTVDAILAYDRWVRFGNSAVEEREASLIQQFYPSLKRIVDPRIFEKMVNGIQICRPEGNPQLLQGDRESLDELYSHLHFIKNVNSFVMELNDKRRQLAEHVLEVLQKQYRLDEPTKTNPRQRQ